jgi:hypothetical protein
VSSAQQMAAESLVTPSTVLACQIPSAIRPPSSALGSTSCLHCNEAVISHTHTHTHSCCRHFPAPALLGLLWGSKGILVSPATSVLRLPTVSCPSWELRNEFTLTFTLKSSAYLPTFLQEFLHFLLKFLVPSP